MKRQLLRHKYNQQLSPMQIKEFQLNETTGTISAIMQSGNNLKIQKNIFKQLNEAIWRYDTDQE